MGFLLGKSKELEGNLKRFHHIIQHSALIFNEGIKDYMEGNKERFESRVSEARELEHEADVLRRNIQLKVYTHMLIPDSRGDVLGLLEALDDIPDLNEKILVNFSIEKPVIRDFMKNDFLKMSDFSLKAIDALIKACNAFYTNMSSVDNFVTKVFFYEHEVDKLQETIKRAIFEADELSWLSEKNQLRYFTEKIGAISDTAEVIGEKLTIYAIKRSI